jgi:hypothetical protein
VAEAFIDEAADDLLCPPCVHDACGELVSASDDLVSGDSAEGDGLGVAWLESDRCTCGDVESLSVSLGAIEAQTRVGFDEVIVGSDLYPFVSHNAQ